MTVSAYRDHPIRASIGRILELQNSPEFADPSIAENETYSFARDKVFGIAHVIQALLNQTPATLTSVHALNQIQANLQAPLNELTAFVSNKNAAHINNAAAQIEQNILPLLWGFSPQLHGLPETPLPDLLEEQAVASRETIRQLNVQRDELATRLQSISAEVDAQNSRLGTLVETAARERAEASAAVAKLEQVFAEKETERSAAFELALGELRKDFASFEAKSKADSQTLLSDLGEQKNKAARIVQVVGNIGVTGNYQQIANAEGRQANFWRWVTVGIFGAGITVAAATFIKFWGQPFTPENAWSVAIRLLYAIAITAPAWYTARESARHRTNADRARQTELELASIGPFIELMPEDKKVEIREQLTHCYFGKSVEPHTVQQPVDAEVLKNLAVEIVKALK